MSKNSSKSETAKTDLEARQKSLFCRNFLNATFLSRLPSALHFPGTLTYLKTLLIFSRPKFLWQKLKNNFPNCDKRKAFLWITAQKDIDSFFKYQFCCNHRALMVNHSRVDKDKKLMAIPIWCLHEVLGESKIRHFGKTFLFLYTEQSCVFALHGFD